VGGVGDGVLSWEPAGRGGRRRGGSGGVTKRRQDGGAVGLLVAVWDCAADVYGVGTGAITEAAVLFGKTRCAPVYLPVRPRRSVCAPGPRGPSSYRRPRIKKGKYHVVLFLADESESLSGGHARPNAVRPPQATHLPPAARSPGRPPGA